MQGSMKKFKQLCTVWCAVSSPTLCFFVLTVHCTVSLGTQAPPIANMVACVNFLIVFTREICVLNIVPLHIQIFYFKVDLLSNATADIAKMMTFFMWASATTDNFGISILDFMLNMKTRHNYFTIRCV